MENTKINRNLAKAMKKMSLFAGQPFYVISTTEDNAVVATGGGTFSVPYVENNGGFAFGAIESLGETDYQELFGVDIQPIGMLNLTTKDREEMGDIDDSQYIIARIVNDSEHNPDKGDYHIIIVEAGITEKKRRIITNEAIESLPLEPYTGLKMYLDHDSADNGKALGVRRVRDLAGKISRSWGVPHGESETGNAQAHAIAHLFPNATGFFESMKDKEFRGAVGVSHVVDYKGFIGKDKQNNKWRVITEIPKRYGVDFVTEAGARGRAAEDAQSISCDAGDDGMESHENQSSSQTIAPTAKTVDKCGVAEDNNSMELGNLTISELVSRRPDLVKEVAELKARESADAGELEAMKTKLAESERCAKEAQAMLRDRDVTDIARSVATAKDSGIPHAIASNVAERIKDKLVALPERDSGKLAERARELLRAEAEYIAKAKGGVEVSVTQASSKAADPKSDTPKNKTKRLLDRLLN